MVKAILFAIVFSVVGLVVFALIAPLIFPNEYLRKVGQSAFPIIVLVLGGIGFVIGLRRRTRRK